MNHKGSTLIEMVMAILIISIAGIMILGGFSATLRVMSNGNKIKNASDTMLSVAEKTNDTKVHDKVNNVPLVGGLLYQITNVNNPNAKLTVRTNVNTINMKSSNDISLKTLESFTLPEVKVKDTESYKTLMKNTVKLIELANKAVKENFENSEKIATHTHLIENPIKNKYYEGKWDTFPNDLLPNEFKNAVNDYSLKVSFPWDFYYSFGKPFHDKKFIYISNHDNYPNAFQIMYEYDARDEYKQGTWYYYPNNSKKYKQRYDENINHTNMAINQDYNAVKSYKEFIDHVKVNGWKKLDIESIYNADNPDTMWK